MSSRCSNPSTEASAQSSLVNHDVRNGIWPRSLALWLMVGYLGLFIIRPWEVLFPWLAEIHIERLYALFMIAVVLVSKKKQFHMDGQTAAVLLFVGSIWLSAVFSFNSDLAWEGFTEYAKLAVIYFVMILVVRYPYDLVFVVVSYVAIMQVYLVKSQWEFFVHGQHRYDMGVVRMTGIETTFGGPNNLAMSIVVSLPLAWFLWTNRRFVSSTWPSFWRKLFPRFLGIYFLLAGSSIVLTNSRSGMISFIVFICLIMLRGKGIFRRLKYVILGIAFLGIAWQVMPEENRGRLETVWAPESGPANARTSAEGRVEGLYAGIEMLKRHPLVGVGVANFALYRSLYLDGTYLEAHNLVGQVLGETGLFGAISFAVMVGVILVNCRSIREKHIEASNRTLDVLKDFSYGCRDAIILLFFAGLFGHNLLRFNWLWLAAFAHLAMQFSVCQSFPGENETIPDMRH